ncbi:MULTISPECIES: LuxR C-terminal-related transcriptional regulator [Moorena]|uniref:ATP-dependent transcriptional regulator n=1 Tax=Moorena producens 3L TaxID=489825 RepID=F4Y0H3_9CYAN|nr:MULTISPECIES: LuxR C-terminal-related transcriptional regulator [Moorena]EGJ29597.1 ATP-dependent transcriptional regulator [Moorena producens 3L]NEP66171.1 LuxR family transcriptional regulator [Moorena sp. SIO3A5]NEQ08484.1 LuxR family transcriptional regulator [Moorena sp. SIO4E2]OLT65482.1 helix-turn-helix transcriptional regulator [Moorena producens 3L]
MTNQKLLTKPICIDVNQVAASSTSELHKPDKKLDSVKHYLSLPQSIKEEATKPESSKPELDSEEGLPLLLKAIIEGFVDGVLILNTNKKLFHANESGRRMCSQISQGKSPINSIPQAIWRVCESLIDSRELFGDRKLILEAEINVDKSVKFRVRVRWLTLELSRDPYLLFTLEDKHQSTKNSAITDAIKYGLSHREKEVWLLKKANFTYEEIAQQLCISINTVKKHLKNIYAKQKEVMQY